ncbi:transcriptional regulator GcvA [Catenovulum adriaticum]|uniref:Transcriptional regulator GcvA n=1 Tax=Catenovulum adriaticum TaxID=2984846 RepID=A0ABY7ASW1_9ALTE|nr:transcriptional regulator GcvA [Catenovulum sp. TS8]WAJ71464.1 transcriptional regulator GcvA [Catenovulum sp. TS8]
MRRLPPLNALRSFEVAARHLSVTLAAEELFVTQAAVSQQIKTLENFLNVKLFIRRNRKLILTEVGASYYFEIKDVFENILDATQAIFNTQNSDSITVGVPPSFAIQWLVPRLNLFSEQFPEIDVRIKAVDLDEGLLTEGVDVAVYLGTGNWKGLAAYKLHTEYLAPVCAPSILNNKMPLDDFEDLRKHTLLHDKSRKYWRLWGQKLGPKDLDVRHGPIFSHSSMVLQAAVLGQGVALGHSVLARPEIEAGRLIEPFSERLITKDAYYLVCRDKDVNDTKISAFIDWALDLIAQEES